VFHIFTYIGNQDDLLTAYQLEWTRIGSNKTLEKSKAAKTKAKAKEYLNLLIVGKEYPILFAEYLDLGAIFEKYRL
jgi:hypothetical protein